MSRHTFIAVDIADTLNLKQCPDCKRWLDRNTEYHKRRGSVQTYCKPCQRARVDANLQRDGVRTRVIQCAKQWRDAHPDRVREYDREYYLRNRDKINARNRDGQRRRRAQRRVD